jgi:WD40 repeat protein
VRFWNLDQTADVRRNVFSRELLRTLFVGEDVTSMKANNFYGTSTFVCKVIIKICVGDLEAPTYVSEGGIRCIKISPDGQHIASGDKQGNLRVHDLNTFAPLLSNEAHDSEILTLDYSGAGKGAHFCRLISSQSAICLRLVVEIVYFTSLM